MCIKNILLCFYSDGWYWIGLYKDINYIPIVTTIVFTGLVCTKKTPVSEGRLGGGGWTDSHMMTAWICGMRETARIRGVIVNRQDAMVTIVSTCGEPTMSGLIVHAACL